LALEGGCRPSDVIAQVCYTRGMIGLTTASKTGMGIVIWFDPKHGCGFIKSDAGGPDLFVRPSVRGATFGTGERVEYTLVTSGERARTEAFIRTKR
jgi:cold shock CspA family protein